MTLFQRCCACQIGPSSKAFYCLLMPCLIQRGKTAFVVTSKVPPTLFFQALKWLNHAVFSLLSDALRPYQIASLRVLETLLASSPNLRHATLTLMPSCMQVPKNISKCLGAFILRSSSYHTCTRSRPSYFTKYCSCSRADGEGSLQTRPSCLF